MRIKNNDNIVIFLICFIVSLVFYYIHTRPGMLRSWLDVIYLLFGFTLPYVVGCVFISKTKNKKRNMGDDLKNGRYY